MALVSMLLGYMGNTMNGDIAWLAMHGAKEMATQAGVSEEEFDRVAREVVTLQKKMRVSNPISEMMP